MTAHSSTRPRSRSRLDRRPRGQSTIAPTGATYRRGSTPSTARTLHELTPHGIALDLAALRRRRPWRPMAVVEDRSRPHQQVRPDARAGWTSSCIGRHPRSAPSFSASEHRRALGVDVVGVSRGVRLRIRSARARMRSRRVLQELRLGARAPQRGLLALALVLAVTVFFYIPVSSLFPLMTFGTSAAAPSTRVSSRPASVGACWPVACSSASPAGASPAIGTISGGVALLGSCCSSAGCCRGCLCRLRRGLRGQGLAVPLFSAPIQALYQRLIEPSMLGRVSSLVGTITLLAAPVGLLIAGPVAERFERAAVVRGRRCGQHRRERGLLPVAVDQGGGGDAGSCRGSRRRRGGRRRGERAGRGFTVRPGRVCSSTGEGTSWTSC